MVSGANTPCNVHANLDNMIVPNMLLPAHMKGGQQGRHTNHRASQQRLPPGALPPAPSGLPAPNTTADLYVSPNAPPAGPNQTAMQVHLEAEFEMATQHGQGDATFRWTHRMYVQDTTDIRDSFPAAPANSAYIPTRPAPSSSSCSWKS
jgi:hypothetical protein